MLEFFETIIEDEIESITYIGEQDTIDIEVDGDRLFFANDILTHNSGVNESDHTIANVAGGMSKVNTVDNFITIYTSPSMRERGEYQLQFLKTRSSSGVGHKVFLKFSPVSLRISDQDQESAEIRNSDSKVEELKAISQRNNFPKTIISSKSASTSDILAKIKNMQRSDD